MTFHGTYRGDHHTYDHAHESPPVMMGPLVLLAAGAVLAGVLFAPKFVGDGAPDFWRESIVLAAHDEAEAEAVEIGGPAPVEGAESPIAELEAPGAAPAAAEEHAAEEAEHAEEGHHVPLWVLWAPFAVTLAGFLIAVFTYLLNEGLGARIAARGGPLHAFLYNKWYFDQLYDVVFVKGARRLGDIFWKTGDERIIDGLGPNGLARAAKAGAAKLSRLQTGYLYHYAFVMLVALVVAVTVLIMLRGGM